LNLQHHRCERLKYRTYHHHFLPSSPAPR
jgi:hypothetical protein